jgi:hypothetical protein
MNYNRSIEELRAETGLNIVAWSANNRGNGDCNLHLAILTPGAERLPTFRQQEAAGTVERDAYTAHWQGQCEKSRIRRALNLQGEATC